MGARIPTPQGSDPRNQLVDLGPDQRPRVAPPAAGPTLNIGPILARTMGHFFPDLNAWIDEIHDPRFLPLVVYHKRFLVWGAEPVPVQVGQPTPTRLPVEHGWAGGAGEPQSPGGHGARQPAEPAGEPDLGILPGENRQRSHHRLAAADGPAVDPHEDSGRGAAAGAVPGLDRRLGLSRVALPLFRGATPLFSP